MKFFCLALLLLTWVNASDSDNISSLNNSSKEDINNHNDNSHLSNTEAVKEEHFDASSIFGTAKKVPGSNFVHSRPTYVIKHASKAEISLTSKSAHNQNMKTIAKYSSSHTSKMDDSVNPSNKDTINNDFSKLASPEAIQNINL